MRESAFQKIWQLIAPVKGKQVPWLLNLGIYQIGWFGLVLGGNDLVFMGVVLLVLHVAMSGRKREDLLFLVLFGFSGIVIDGSLKAVGFFSFTHDNLLLPLWLLLIWLLLATLPGHALSWLQGRVWLNCLFGAIAGPIAYFGGRELGAAVIHWPTITAILVLAVIWGIYWPLAMHCASKIYASRNMTEPQGQ